MSITQAEKSARDLAIKLNKALREVAAERRKRTEAEFAEREIPDALRPHR